MKSVRNISGGAVLMALTLSGITTAADAQAPASRTEKYKISRASLAQSATFTVTQTLAPRDGKPLVREFHIEVKGEKARMDYEDQIVGSVRYLANERGVFLYVPANKNAMKQSLKGGVGAALQAAFAQVNERMESAKKVGSATVAGMPTTIYKDARTGGTVYISQKPGFRLPVKSVLTNEGGATSMEVKDIKLNVSLDDSRFALPPGTKIIESENQGTPGGVPMAR